jgi:hypothetical protein
MHRRHKAHWPAGVEQPWRVRPQIVRKLSFVHDHEAFPLITGRIQYSKAADGNGIRRCATESRCDFNVPFSAKIEYADRAAGCTRSGFYSLRENMLRAKRLWQGAQNEICGPISWETLYRTWMMPDFRQYLIKVLAHCIRGE